MKKLFFAFCCAASIISCNNADKTTDAKKDTVATTTIDTSRDTAAPTPDSSISILGKFVEFTFGDAPHYFFETRSGQKIEFGNDEDTLIKFAVELPENKTNAENQGWASAKTLEGKWFNLKYVTKKMVQYEGGPLEDVKVIVAAKPVQ